MKHNHINKFIKKMFIKSEKHKRRINEKFAEKERNQPENSMAINGAGTEVTIRRNKSETRTLQGKAVQEQHSRW
jgi:hypothetical protein